MLGAPGDVVDPLSQPTAFSFLPRTVAAAGFAVSSEIQLDQTFSRLISVGAKENVSNPYTNSDVMENERNENIRNNVMERRLPPMHKRGRFSLLPEKELDPVPIVDYSVLAHIEDPYEFFKTSERLEKAEKEIKRLRGEVITEDYQPRPRRPRPGLRRTSYTHTYTLPDTLLEDSPLSGSQNASPPKDSNTAKEGLNAIPVEVSSSVKDTAPKRASTTIVDTLLSTFKNITKDQEEAVLWETLKLKPTDIGEMNIRKLLKSRMDNNPVSSSKGCLIPETSEGIASARNPYPAISELQRQIFERNPLMKSPIVTLPDDDDLIEDPFPSASRPSASSLSPKDVLKSGEKNPESSKGLEEKVSSGAASSSKFTSVFQQFSFQDEENVMPSYAGPSDAADNTVEEIASQVKVPEVSRFEVDKDVSTGGKNAQKSRSPFHANKTGNRIGKDVFASVDHEFSLDDEPSSQNVNVGTHDGPVADSGDTSLPDKEELVPTRKRGRPRKLNKEISNTTPKSCSGDAVDLQSSNPPDSSNINIQALEAPKDGAGSKVSLQNPIVNSQEKLVPSRKRGRPRKLNKEISNTTPKICSGDSVDVPSQNPPVSSNINIQVAQEESQIRKGRKRTVGRQSKRGSSSNERSLPGLDGQPEIPPPTSENEAQVEASPMESPREKKQMAAPRKQSKKKANLRKSLADGGLVWEAGVRRSTRVKSRPLKYWLGERFLYSRIHASLATVVGVKALSPTSKGPVMKVKSFVPDKYTELVEKIGKY